MLGNLPQGCALCLRGLKSIMFVTGICRANCFYCPISRARKGIDVMYINDVPVTSVTTIIREVDLCASAGLAITGGEPVLVLDRVFEICRTLKSIYGQDFHIHMYTNVLHFNRTIVRKLCTTPLDELRLHVIDPYVAARLMPMLRFLRRCSSFDIGLEVPALPDKVDDILRVVELLYEYDVVQFVNLNEVDVSESNESTLRSRGYVIDQDGTVRGSYEAALKILSQVRQRGINLSVHVCCSWTKDLVQIGLRYFLRNVMYSRASSMLEPDGTLVEAVLDGRHVHPSLREGLIVRYLPRGNRYVVVETF